MAQKEWEIVLLPLTLPAPRTLTAVPSDNSEIKLSRKLDLPRSIDLRWHRRSANPSEISIRGIRVYVAELRMVEGIERVKAKLQANGLVDRKVLPQADVPVVQVRIAHRSIRGWIVADPGLEVVVDTVLR